MAVYVDELIPTAKKPNWPYSQSCHLTADSLEELHTFATRLGLQQKWYQHDSNLAKCHYDLVPGMRQKALNLGATVLTPQQCGERIRLGYQNAPVSTATGRVIPFGYANGGVLALESLMVPDDAFLVDIRLVPYGWGIFKKVDLEARYPRRYVHIPELGNLYYKRPELGIKIANLARGIPRLVRGIQQGRTLIVMCGCREHHGCHREIVIQKLLEVMPDAEVTMPDVVAPANTLKALSINQPWGSLVASGRKGIENRSWCPEYRGSVLVHVGAKFDDECFTTQGETTNRFADYVRRACGLTEIPLREAYPLKSLIGIVDLVDVVTESTSPWFNGSGYGWVFENARPFDKPIPYSGKPNLFDVPIEVVSSQLPVLDLMPSK